MKKTLFLALTLFLSSTFAVAQFVADDVLLYMPFNGNFNDQSNKSVTITEHANTTNSITYEAGKFGQAGFFNQTFFVTDGVSFDASSDFTIAAWIKLARTSADKGKGHTIAHQFNGTTTGRIHLEVNPSGNPGSYTGGIRNDDSTTVLEANVWYHLAKVYNTSDQKMYLFLDGVCVDTAEIGIESNTEDMAIGTQKGLGVNSAGLHGLLDDLVLINKALGLSDIESIKTTGVEAILNGGSSINTINNAVNYATLERGVYLFNSLTQANASYKVYNMNGKVVSNGNLNSNVLNISQLNSGLYFVSINNGGKVLNVKLIK